MCISPAPIIGADSSSELPPFSSPLAVTVGYTSPRLTSVVGTPAARDVESDRYNRKPPQASPATIDTRSKGTRKLRGRRRLRRRWVTGGDSGRGGTVGV